MSLPEANPLWNSGQTLPSTTSHPIKPVRYPADIPPIAHARQGRPPRRSGARLRISPPTPSATSHQLHDSGAPASDSLLYSLSLSFSPEVVFTQNI